MKIHRHFRIISTSNFDKISQISPAFLNNISLFDDECNVKKVYLDSKEKICEYKFKAFLENSIISSELYLFKNKKNFQSIKDLPKSKLINLLNI